MVSSPPVELLVDEEKGRAAVHFTTTGNDHVVGVGENSMLAKTEYQLDPRALRQLASQAEEAADRLEGDDGGEDR